MCVIKCVVCTALLCPDACQMAMRHLALECLVTVMQSLVDFSKELASTPPTPAGALSSR